MQLVLKNTSITPSVDRYQPIPSGTPDIWYAPHLADDVARREDRLDDDAVRERHEERSLGRDERVGATAPTRRPPERASRAPRRSPR